MASPFSLPGCSMGLPLRLLVKLLLEHIPASALVLLLVASQCSCSTSTDTYLVYTPLDAVPASFASSPGQWHVHILTQAIPDAKQNVHQRLLYSYKNVVHGFAALLSQHEAAVIRSQVGVGVVVRLDTVAWPHTTRSPLFLGLLGTSSASSFLHNDAPWLLWDASKKGDGVIVGVLDSGVWPQGRRSFGDAGLSHIPARWKGACESSSTFNATMLCNRKLIGAKAYYRGYEAETGPINTNTEFKSPLDGHGHGTHTSSTVAGRIVQAANLFGYANGTASGMAPLARVAIYKVCWAFGCNAADILAGFDAAISDGVDVITISLGSEPMEYFLDPIAIGSFAASAAGIITSSSAGNAGPNFFAVTNVAPWILTVAASSIDRDFPASVTLGNGKSYAGSSLYSGKGLAGRQLPLIYAGNAALPGRNVSLARLCIEGLLNASLIRDKVVFCDRGTNARVEKGAVVRQLGATAMILGNAVENGEELLADSHLLPATQLGAIARKQILEYLNSTEHPTATINFSGTKLGVTPAPVMTVFSSRGLNPITPEILKPDVAAPGLNILAAWTGIVGPGNIPIDKRMAEFNVLSGTSMASAHVAGITALLRAAHPKWSPAAIKSAIMTSAVTTNNVGKSLLDPVLGSSSTFSYGAGHVNPNAALHPGLVYDISTQDYFHFLCSLHYAHDNLRFFSMGYYECGNTSSIKTPTDLNYPSISVLYNQTVLGSSFTTTISRTLTNVGPINSTYRHRVNMDKSDDLTILVQPKQLKFDKHHQKLSYKVTLIAKAINMSSYTYISSGAQLIWFDHKHSVQSPIVFTWARNEVVEGQ